MAVKTQMCAYNIYNTHIQKKAHCICLLRIGGWCWLVVGQAEIGHVIRRRRFYSWHWLMASIKSCEWTTPFMAHLTAGYLLHFHSNIAAVNENYSDGLVLCMKGDDVYV